MSYANQVDRHRITKAKFNVGDRHFTLIFTVEGLKVRQRFQRDPRVLSFAQLVEHAWAQRPVTPPTKPSSEFPPGSVCEQLDVTACALHELAVQFNGRTATKEHCAHVRTLLKKAGAIVKSMQVVSENAKK